MPANLVILVCLLIFYFKNTVGWSKNSSNITAGRYYGLFNCPFCLWGNYHSAGWSERFASQPPTAATITSMQTQTLVEKKMPLL